MLTILVLLAFTLVTLDYRSGALGGARSAGTTVFGPIESGVSDVVSPIGSFFSSLGHLDSFKDENAQLRAQIAKLQTEQRLTASERAQLAQLEGIDHLAGEARFHVVPAQVTAVGSSLGFEWTATINRGSDNGIAANETVIDGSGLVGRVMKGVGPTSATILLGSDPQFTAGARLAGSQELGSVTGGRTAMTLTLYSASTTLAPGDQLVTAGSINDRPFVPEVPIGRVTKVTSTGGSLVQTATVSPYVNFFAVNEVAVVTKAPQNIRNDSLLPPSPTPSPTPTVTKTVTAPPSTPSSPDSSASSTP